MLFAVRIALVIGAMATLTAQICEAADPHYAEEFVFDPAAESHGHVHASTVVECPGGDLLVVYYENGPKLPSPRYYNERQDKSDDVRIGGSRKPHGSAVWESPFVMNDTFGVSDNNPTLVVDNDGKLWLFHSTMLGAPKWTWSSSLLQYKISSDYQTPGPPKWEKSGLLIPHPQGLGEVIDRLETHLKSPELRKSYGITEQRADALVKHMRGLADDPMRQRLGWMPRVHPLIRSDGSLVVPLSNENFEIPMMAITSDGGRTWTYSEPVPATGLIQPSLVEFPDGDIAAYFRNGDPRHRIKRSTSTDGGLTWSVPELTDRLHPGGGIEVLLLENGHLALIYNNKERGPRDKLAVSISTDQGQTWKWTRQLEDTPNGRFDYPSMIQGQNGTIHVTYSYNLKTIKHVEFNEEWVMSDDES